MDLCLIGIMGMLLTYVWRVQALWAVVLVPLRLALVSSVIAMVAFLASSDPRRRLDSLPATKLGKMVLALAGLILVSGAFGIYPGRSYDFVRLDFLPTFLFFVLVAAGVRSVVDVERLAMIQVVGALLFSFVVLRRFEIGPSGRLGNLPSYDANDLAMFLICTMSMAVYFLRRGVAPLIRIGALGSILVFIVVLVRTGSRGGFIAFLALLTYLLFNLKGVSVRLRAAVVGVGVLTLLTVGSGTYWETMGTMLRPSEDYNFSGNSPSGRMEIWKRGFGYMMERPLTGVGAGNFAAAEGWSDLNRQRQEEGRGWIWKAPHSIYVQIGAETGVTGLVLFVSILVVAIRSLRGLGSGRSPPGDPRIFLLGQLVTGSIIAYAVAGIFLSQAYSAFLYSALGMTVALLRLGASSGPSPRSAPAPRAGRRGAPPAVPMVR